MPRKQKTLSGDDTQKVSSISGQRYGEGVESANLQATLPAPNVKAEVQASMPAGAPLVGRPAPDPAAIQAFLGANKPNMLGATQMPDQPVTDGLSTGPGRGPSAIAGRATTPVARYMQQLSSDTGNPKWKRLAERAGL